MLTKNYVYLFIRRLVTYYLPIYYIVICIGPIYTVDYKLPTILCHLIIN